MKNTILGIICIILGSGAVIFRKSNAKQTIDFQNRTFGFHFGKSQLMYSEFLYAVIGLIFAFIGVATLLGMVKWK